MDGHLSNLISWLENNKIQISTYLPEEIIDHPVLSQTKIVYNIIKSIKLGDLNAIELGCELVLYNKLIPFGRTIKSNIYLALKSQVRFIRNEHREKLSVFVRDCWFDL